MSPTADHDLVDEDVDPKLRGGGGAALVLLEDRWGLAVAVEGKGVDLNLRGENPCICQPEVTGKDVDHNLL